MKDWIIIFWNLILLKCFLLVFFCMLMGERNLYMEDLDLFFKFDEDGVKFSYFCNWCLMSLDEIYEKVFGVIVFFCICI